MLVDVLLVDVVTFLLWLDVSIVSVDPADVHAQCSALMP